MEYYSDIIYWIVLLIVAFISFRGIRIQIRSNRELSKIKSDLVLLTQNKFSVNSEKRKAIYAYYKACWLYKESLLITKNMLKYCNSLLYINDLRNRINKAEEKLISTQSILLLFYKENERINNVTISFSDWQVRYAVLFHALEFYIDDINDPLHNFKDDLNFQNIILDTQIEIENEKVFEKLMQSIKSVESYFREEIYSMTEN